MFNNLMNIDGHLKAVVRHFYEIWGSEIWNAGNDLTWIPLKDKETPHLRMRGGSGLLQVPGLLLRPLLGGLSSSHCLGRLRCLGGFGERCRLCRLRRLGNCNRLYATTRKSWTCLPFKGHYQNRLNSSTRMRLIYKNFPGNFLSLG